VTFERLGLNKQNIINQWKHLDQTIVFDEWIANTDRHEGNLVYEPVSKSYWLIDHGRALGGMPPAFIDLSDSGMRCSNQLLNGLTPHLNHDYRLTLQTQANKLMLECQTIDLQRLDHDNHFAKLNTVLSRQDVIDFLTQRIHQTTELLCEKIGIPMMAPAR
jgi:hypothetical protein